MWKGKETFKRNVVMKCLTTVYIKLPLKISHAIIKEMFHYIKFGNDI